LSERRDTEELAVARRFQERFNEEIVERFSLCPWAQPARKAGRVLVESSRAEDAASIRDAVRGQLAEALGDYDLVQLVFPLARLEWRAWERLLSQFVEDRTFDVQRWAGAAFHPGFPVVTTTAGGRVRTLRKSPDPSWQFIAREALPPSNDTTYLSEEELQAAIAGEFSEENRNITQEVRRRNEEQLVGESSEELLSAIDALIEERHR
jgi:hypothetical protein